MMERRTFLAAAGATAVAASTTALKAAQSAGNLVDVKIDPWNQPPELLEKWKNPPRFLRQDDESRLDFTRGMTSFLTQASVRPEAQAHQAAFLKSKGVNPLDDFTLSDKEAFEILVQDPMYAAHTRLARTNFAYHWEAPRRAFYKDADYYLGELEKAEKMGPGRLELNPDLNLPEYTRHEVHSMPGGYVGDEFAGWTYSMGHVYGTDALRDRGRSISYGQGLVLPKDGKVVRILDLGCSMGDSTLGIKARFPDVEVWGIDVGAPLLRFAHYQAVKYGYDVIFSQRDAGATGFPDGYFDMVASSILFHEVSPEARGPMVKEIHRILRPGGVYTHADFMTEGHPDFTPTATITGLASRWVDFRHNVEPWSPAYRKSNFPKLLSETGFEVDFSGKWFDGSRSQQRAWPNVAGFKRA